MGSVALLYGARVWSYCDCTGGFVAGAEIGGIGAVVVVDGMPVGEDMAFGAVPTLVEVAGVEAPSPSIS